MHRCTDVGGFKTLQDGMWMVEIAPEDGTEVGGSTNVDDDGVCRDSQIAAACTSSSDVFKS